jgi:hypothetical protein
MKIKNTEIENNQGKIDSSFMVEKQKISLKCCITSEKLTNPIKT